MTECESPPPGIGLQLRSDRQRESSSWKEDHGRCSAVEQLRSCGNLSLTSNFQRTEEGSPRARHVPNSIVECDFIRLRRSAEPADFPYKLERCIVQLLVARLLVGTPQPLDIPAHRGLSLLDNVDGEG